MFPLKMEAWLLGLSSWERSSCCCSLFRRKYQRMNRHVSIKMLKRGYNIPISDGIA
ncbi:MAG: hypothetical protein ACP5F6_10020 [Microbacter sp.]